MLDLASDAKAFYNIWLVKFEFLNIILFTQQNLFNPIFCDASLLKSSEYCEKCMLFIAIRTDCCECHLWKCSSGVLHYLPLVSRMAWEPYFLSISLWNSACNCLNGFIKLDGKVSIMVFSGELDSVIFITCKISSRMTILLCWAFYKHRKILSSGGFCDSAIILWSMLFDI